MNKDVLSGGNGNVKVLVERFCWIFWAAGSDNG